MSALMALAIEKVHSVRVVEVVEMVFLVGNETDNDHRLAERQYWTKDGELISSTTIRLSR